MQSYVRWIVWGVVGVAVAVVLWGRVPARTAEWLGRRAVLEAEVRGADVLAAREAALRAKIQADLRTTAAKLRADDRGRAARRQAAVRAITHAAPVCRQQLAPVIVEDSSNRRRLALLETQHQEDLRLIVSWQWQDSVDRHVTRDAVALVRTAPIPTSFLGRLFHPQIEVGVGPAWTLDDRALHPAAISLVLGWPL